MTDQINHIAYAKLSDDSVHYVRTNGKKDGTHVGRTLCRRSMDDAVVTQYVEVVTPIGVPTHSLSGKVDCESCLSQAKAENMRVSVGE